jgi:hypothetical protein
VLLSQSSSLTATDELLPAIRLYSPHLRGGLLPGATRCLAGEVPRGSSARCLRRAASNAGAPLGGRAAVATLGIPATPADGHSNVAARLMGEGLAAVGPNIPVLGDSFVPLTAPDLSYALLIVSYPNAALLFHWHQQPCAPTHSQPCLAICPQVRATAYNQDPRSKRDTPTHRAWVESPS